MVFGLLAPTILRSIPLVRHSVSKAHRMVIVFSSIIIKYPRQYRTVRAGGQQPVSFITHPFQSCLLLLQLSFSLHHSLLFAIAHEITSLSSVFDIHYYSFIRFRKLPHKSLEPQPFLPRPCQVFQTLAGLTQSPYQFSINYSP